MQKQADAINKQLASFEKMKRRGHGLEQLLPVECCGPAKNYL